MPSPSLNGPGHAEARLVHVARVVLRHLDVVLTPADARHDDAQHVAGLRLLPLARTQDSKPHVHLSPRAGAHRSSQPCASQGRKGRVRLGEARESAGANCVRAIQRVLAAPLRPRRARHSPTRAPISPRARSQLASASSFDAPRATTEAKRPQLSTASP